MSKYARIVEGIVVEIVDLGDFRPSDVFTPEISDSFVLCENANAAPGWIFDGINLAAPSTFGISLSDAKSSKISELTSECAALIIAGYKSSALGKEHEYPSGIIDQINMMGSVTASLLPGLPSNWSTPFWCKDQFGEWSFRPHAASEIQIAGSDGKNHVVRCQNALDKLSKDVFLAKTLDEVNSISWAVD